MGILPGCGGHNGPVFRHHPVLSIVTFAYLGVVAWLTLGPQPLDDRGDGLLRRLLGFLGRRPETDWITYNGIEFAANIAMFVPVGLFFVLLLGRRRWWLAIMLGVLLTCVIEYTQLFLPTRVSDPRDLLSNSIGTVIGVTFALLWTWPAAYRRAADRRRRAEPVRRRA